MQYSNQLQKLSSLMEMTKIFLPSVSNQLKKISGPNCSKLTMSLVNVSLKIFIIKYGIYANIFAEKKCE